MHILSDQLHERVMGITPTPYREAVRRFNQGLGDLSKAPDAVDPVELPIPDYLGNVEDLIVESSKGLQPLLVAIQSLIDESVPDYATLVADIPFPQSYCPGWHRFNVKARKWGQWTITDAPVGPVHILDFESIPLPGFGYTWVPFMAFALGHGGLYMWVYDALEPKTTLEWSDGPSVIVGHNISYDRQFIAQEYLKAPSGLSFFDTMGAWIAIRGMSGQQRPAYAKMAHQSDRPLWVNETAPNGLGSVHEFYTGHKVDKGTRDAFVDRGKAYIKGLEEIDNGTAKPGTELPNLGDYLTEHWQTIARYCMTDVIATLEVLGHVWPEWLEATPSPVSRLAHFTLGKPWVPHGDRLDSLYTTVEAKRREVSEETKRRVLSVADGLIDSTGYRSITVLSKSGKSYLRIDEDTLAAFVATLDSQLASLDWQTLTTGPNKGLPAWYPALKKNPVPGTRLVVMVLGVCWVGRPVYYVHTGNTGYWATSAGPIDDPGKPGNPLKTLFTKETAKTEGLLSTTRGIEAQEVLDTIVAWSTWVSIRSRVAAVHTEAPEGYRVVLPSICPTGTLTRRCADALYMVMPNAKGNKPGSEFKSTIEAPEGYKIVGADCASQELWLAAILGDRANAVLGATKLSRMVLVGQKDNRTDPHSVLADQQDISRDSAKTVWYGLIYGLGLSGLKDALMTAKKGAKPEELEALARSIMGAAKGQFNQEYGCYIGGLASETFNELRRIGSHKRPRSPVLRAAMTRALAGIKDYGTSRTNWAVQTSGVDFRDLLVVFMDYLISREGLDARFMLCIHDEVRYICADQDAARLAYLLQIAHLYTRAKITQALGFEHLPIGSSWFPEVDVDQYLRKDSGLPCTTPTQTKALAPGYALTPRDTLEALFTTKPMEAITCTKHYWIMSGT
jgi:DNA polymerase gamma 1